jgi:hypothetical protein
MPADLDAYVEALGPHERLYRVEPNQSVPISARIPRLPPTP